MDCWRLRQHFRAEMDAYDYKGPESKTQEATKYIKINEMVDILDLPWNITKKPSAEVFAFGGGLCLFKIWIDCSS